MMDPNSGDPAWQLRKYLLLLAMLMATATYIAGLDPPGGVWLETKDRHRTGDPILPATRPIRYTLFYYCNATAFGASLVVIILLFKKEEALRMMPAAGYVMVLDLLCLMVAYVAGSSRGHTITIAATVLCVVVFLFVLHFTLLPKCHEPSASNRDDGGRTMTEVSSAPNHNGDHGGSALLQVKEQRKVLMLLAIFVTTVTYTAGLNPPGGFWEHAQEGGEHDGRRAGDPILLQTHLWRFVVFLFCNTSAFSASVVTITLLLRSRLAENSRHLAGLYGAIAVALLGLTGAYAAGSSRAYTTVDVVFYLLVLFSGYIFIVAVLDVLSTKLNGREHHSPLPSATESVEESVMAVEPAMVAAQHASEGSKVRDPLQNLRSLILLLATLVATVTFQAGLAPPGGFWHDDGNGHKGGDIILAATNAARYKVFFYCNSVAFVASIVVVIMVKERSLVSPHALKAAVILDLFGLMGAYAAGSGRDVLISIYIFALLAAIIFFLMVITVTLPASEEQNDNTRKMDKVRKPLLLVAILAVSITYQAGLTPPGKFWLEDGIDGAHHLGDPVLADIYPWRYKVFVYCNGTSFMASVAAIIFWATLKSSSRRYWLTLGVLGVGLAGLLGAYAAGSTRRAQTSMYIFALSGGVVLFFFAVLYRLVVLKLGRSISAGQPEPVAPPRNCAIVRAGVTAEYIKEYRMRKYLMLLGILAASVTYQAGLAPPGGVWPEDGGGHFAGDPTLNDADRWRYRTFFYSNSTSFVASIVVIVLLQHSRTTKLRGSWFLWALNTAAVLDLLGLVVAYATGSSREWSKSTYVLAMVTTVLSYVAIYLVLSIHAADSTRVGSGSSPQRPSPLQEAAHTTA